MIESELFTFSATLKSAPGVDSKAMNFATGELAERPKLTLLWVHSGFMRGL